VVLPDAHSCTPSVLSFNCTAPTEIYTLSYTTLFRSLLRSGVGKTLPAVRDTTQFRRSQLAGEALQRYPIGFASKLAPTNRTTPRSEEHTSELQSRENLVCRLLLEKKKKKTRKHTNTA